MLGQPAKKSKFAHFSFFQDNKFLVSSVSYAVNNKNIHVISYIKTVYKRNSE